MKVKTSIGRTFFTAVTLLVAFSGPGSLDNIGATSSDASQITTVTGNIEQAVFGSTPSVGFSHLRYLMEDAHYGVFGNYQTGDCVVVAGADLIQRDDPEVSLSTSKVYKVFSQLGGQPGNPNSSVDPLAFLALWRSQGILGTTISSYTRLNADDQQQITKFANTRGVYALILWTPTMGHAVLMTGASTAGVVLVMYGNPSLYSWSWWDAHQGGAWAVNGLRVGSAL